MIGFVSGHGFSHADPNRNLLGFSPCEWRDLPVMSARKMSSVARTFFASQILTRQRRRRGLKPWIEGIRAARLKPCPDTNHTPVIDQEWLKLGLKCPNSGAAGGF